MKFYLILLISVLTSISVNAQDFIAVQDGNWNDGATWGNASPGVEGLDWPGSGNDVAVDGFAITLSRNQNFSCNVIFFSFNISNQLVVAGGRGATPTLTIEESMIADDGFPNFIPTAPTVQLFDDGIDITFTGENITGFGGLDEILGPWSSDCVFGKVKINQLGADDVVLSEIMPITDELTLTNGTFEIASGGAIIDNNSTSANFTTNASTELIVNGAINGDGSNSSRFNAVTINGLARIRANGYINSTDITLGALAELNVAFAGPDQQQGWWFQTTGPNGAFDLDALSTVVYSASADQSVGALEYGNLSLLSPVSASTKSLQTGNTLIIQGDLIINSANVTFNTFSNIQNISIGGDLVDNGTWEPSQLVIFDGVTAQTISGNAEVIFNGGVRISNTDEVILSNIGMDINGELDIDPGCTLNPFDQNVNISGDMRIDGTLLAGSDRGFIFDGTTNYFGSGSRNFNDFTITSSGNVTGPAAQLLSIAGSFTNDGVFDNNDGTIDMTGIGSRAIDGSSETLFNLLNVSGGTINNNNPSVKISEGITIGSSTVLDADGSGSGTFTLISTASDQTAYVGVIPSSSSITGNVTAERYFSPGRFFRYLGSPVLSTTVADWQEEFPITGTFSDPSTGTFDGIALISDNPSLFFWDAAISDYEAYPTSGTAASNPVVSGRGYVPFIRNNTTNIIGAVTGVLNQQNASLPVAFDPAAPGGDSWNLVANPYAAPVDWDEASWTKTNIANEVHVPLTSGGFATYIAGVGNNGGSQYVASGQAFWVRATAASPVLATTENIKSVSQEPTYFRTIPIEQLKIELSHDDKKDAVVLALRDEATFDFDDQFDAKRLLNLNDFGYTLSIGAADENILKISSIPKTIDDNCLIEIPLLFEDVTLSGAFVFSFTQISQILPYYSLQFEDTFTGTLIELNADASYSFEVNEEALSKASDRFKLIVNADKALNTSLEVNAENSCADEDNASINISNAEVGVTYYLLNASDTLASETAVSSSLVLNIPSDGLSIGNNLLDIALSKGACSSAFIAEAIDVTVSQTPVIQSLENMYNCKGESAEINVNADIEASSYSLLKDGKVILTSMDGSFNIIADTTTTYSVIAQNETSCPSNEVVFTVFVSNLEQPTVVPNGNVLEASVKGVNYQWFYEGVLIEDENNAMIVVSRDGNYQVEVSNTGCTKLSDGYFFQQQVTSITQKELNEIKIYPNPVLDKMQLENTLDELDLAVMTIDGRFIFRKSLEIGINNVDMSFLDAGLYLIRLDNSNGESVTNRIIKD